MKKFVFTLVCVIFSLSAFLFPSEVAAAAKSGKSNTSWVSKIPVNLVIEQTATLSDGRNVTLYYQKKGDLCEVYSEDNLKGYNVTDLLKLNSTSFRIVSSVKGKRVYHATFTQVRRIIKNAVNTYL